MSGSALHGAWGEEKQKHGFDGVPRGRREVKTNVPRIGHPGTTAPTMLGSSTSIFYQVDMQNVSCRPHHTAPLPPYPLILADRAGRTYPNRICRTSSKSYAQQTLDLALNRLTHILGRCFASYSVVSIYLYTGHAHVVMSHP